MKRLLTGFANYKSGELFLTRRRRSLRRARGTYNMEIYTMLFGFHTFPDTHFVCYMRTIGNCDTDMLIGTCFLSEFCDLHIFGADDRFELIFR